LTLYINKYKHQIFDVLTHYINKYKQLKFLQEQTTISSKKKMVYKQLMFLQEQTKGIIIICGLGLRTSGIRV